MADYIASSGTLVTAVLESAGFFYQSYVLETLKEPFFKGSVGAFVYLIGVVVAMFHTAIRGAYKFGPWLLIGPPLFFSMILPTAETSTSAWRFATQDRNQARVDEEFERIVPGEGKTKANVSKVFYRYNALVSQTVQEIVKVINREKSETDKWFILRSQLFANLNTHSVRSPELKQMIQHALFGRCGRLVTSAQLALDVNVTQGRRDVATRDLQNYADGTDQFNPNKEIAKYIENILNDPAVAEGRDELLQCVNGETTAEAISTQKLECKCIWGFVYHGILSEARSVVEAAMGRAAANDISRGKIVAQWANAFNLLSSDPLAAPSIEEARTVDAVVKAIAKYILRNEHSNQTFAGQISDLAAKGSVFDTVETPPENNLAMVEYARQRQQEWAEKTRLLTTASNLPYYQGLLLFFLAFAFPFFAMLLLVPGKHAGFIQWFVLWLWVKSWDIGFAIVMQLDDILFSMMKFTKELRTDLAHKDELQREFALAMYALKEHDPTFQMSMYYNVIAVCLAAVPVVLSQFILGSLSGGAGIISQGMRVVADDFAAGSRNTAGQQVTSSVRHQLQENIQSRAALYYQNISQYKMASVNLGPGLGESRARATGGRQFDVAHVGAPQSGAHLSGPAATGRQQIDFAGVTSAGKEANRSLERMNYTLSDLQNSHQIYRSLQGFTQGVKDPKSLHFVPIPALKALDSVTKGLEVIKSTKKYGDEAMLGPMGAIFKAQADYYGEVGEAHIDPAMKWAIWDAFYCEEGRRLAAIGRMYDMIEVPWTASETGEIAEGGLEYKYLEQEAKLHAAYMEAMGDSQAAASTGWLNLIPKK